jgi:P pilus assembly chaperone PapD
MKLINLALIIFLICSFSASAGVLINPKRVLLSDGERGAALDLVNESENTIRYQIFFKQKIMAADGAIVDLVVEDPDGIYAKDMIRYSPRRVDIVGGGRQTIRIAARRPKSLPDGEYLSHLIFKEIPNKIESKAATGDDVFSVSINPSLQIAIPIIVRKGSLSSIASLESVNLEASDKDFKNGSVTFKLRREGDMSLYGTVEVFELVDSVVGDRVGLSRGVALYTHLNERTVTQRLDRPLSENASALLIRYDEDKRYGGTNFIEYTLNLK